MILKNDRFVGGFGRKHDDFYVGSKVIGRKCDQVIQVV